MTEEEFMNQGESSAKILTARLYLDDNVDYLEFDISGKIHKLNLNNEDDQEQIKRMFCDLVELVEGKDVRVQIEVQDGYDNPLLEEVSKSYISDLNNELDSVRANLTNQE